MIIQTKRLYLRQLTQYDYMDLCEILQDKEVMYAYEHAFSNDEVQKWLDKQLERYYKFGFGLWAIIDKETEDFIGQAGLSIQDCEEEKLLEIGYLLKKKYWHKGYAIEAAMACKEYAFNILNYTEVYSIIRDNNINSQNVAKKNGMKIIKQFIKHYYNIDMPHYVFSVKNI